MTDREMLEHAVEVLEEERDDRDAGLTTMLLDLLEAVRAHLEEG